MITALTILAIAWVPIITAAKLWYDLRLWFNREIKGTSNKTVQHKAEWLIVAITTSPAVYQLSTQTALPWYCSITLSALMCAIFIWVLFDGLYNLFRGYHWWYTGSVDADDATTDKLLRKYGTAAHVIKYAAFVATIIFYIKYYTA